MKAYLPLLDAQEDVLSMVPLERARAPVNGNARANFGPTYTIGGAWSSSDWAKLVVQTWRLLNQGDQELRDPFSQNPWIYAATSLKARSLSCVPIQVWKGRAGDESEDRKVPRFHPAQRLVDRPNPMSVGADLVASYSLSMDLHGEWIAFLYDSAGSITTDPARAAAIVTQDPASLDAVPSERGIPRIVAWKVKRAPDLAVPFEASLYARELCPAMFPSKDCLRGHAPLSAAILGARNEWKIKRANESAIENGCSFGGMLIGREWDHNEVEAVRREIREKYAGALRQANVMVVGGSEATFVPNNTNQEKMQYVGQLGWYRQEVLSCLGVPATLVSLSEDVNYATAIDAKRWFWAHTQMPRMEKLESALDRALFEPQGLYCRFDRDAVATILEDWKSKLEWGKSLKEIGPWSGDEINGRLALGMPKNEHSGKCWMNGAMRTTDQLAKMEEMPKMGEAEKGKPGSGEHEEGEGMHPPEDANTQRPSREPGRSEAEIACVRSLRNFLNAQRRAFGYRMSEVERGKVIEESRWPWEKAKWNERLHEVLEPSWLRFAEEAGAGDEEDEERAQLLLASVLDERRRSVEMIEVGFRSRVLEAIRSARSHADARAAVNAVFNRDRDLRCEIIASEERAAVHESVSKVLA